MNIENFYNLLKRNLSTGNSFTLNLMDAPADEIRDTTYFCAKLTNYALLSSYKYNKYIKKINATPQRSGRIINFFSGAWYERFIFLKTISFLNQNGIEYYSLRNLQVLIADSYDYELDLLFLIEGKPFWIECKVGDHQSYIGRLTEIRRMLAIPPDNTFLVVLNLAEQLSFNLSKLHEITVANQQNFITSLSNSLNLNDDSYSGYGLDSIYSNGDKVLINSEALLNAFFKKIGMRPFVDERNNIIRSVIAFFEFNDTHISLKNLKTYIAQKLNLSKNIVQEVLKVLFYSNIFLGVNGEVVEKFSDEISGIDSVDEKQIDEKCIVNYAKAVKKVDRNYFNIAENFKIFQDVVSGKTISDNVVNEIMMINESDTGSEVEE